MNLGPFRILRTPLNRFVLGLSNPERTRSTSYSERAKEPGRGNSPVGSALTWYKPTPKLGTDVPVILIDPTLHCLIPTELLNRHWLENNMERYWLIGGGAVLAVLLVASIAVGLMRSAAEFEPDSPEFAVQRYIQDLVQEDFEAAAEVWSPTLSEQCSFDRFLLDTKNSLERLRESRITLDDVQELDETTVVSVRVTRTRGGGPFGPSEWHSTSRFALQLSEDDWRIVGHEWPADRCVREHFNQPLPPDATPVRGVD